MKNLLIILGVIIVIIAIGGYSMVSSYNTMVKLNGAIDSQWATVESKLQRRFDLIPNLVNAVKASMAQEKEVFGNIAEARSNLQKAGSQEEKMKASNEMESAISRLLVVVEAYPELKSSTNVSQLMDELAGTENRISVERDRYNIDVKNFNNYIKSFPRSLYAGKLGFSDHIYFKAENEAKETPVVDFNH